MKIPNLSPILTKSTRLVQISLKSIRLIPSFTTKLRLSKATCVKNTQCWCATMGKIFGLNTYLNRS